VASQPYSQLLFATVLAPGGPTTIYTVPEGKVAVLKAVTLIPFGATGQLNLVDTDSGAYIWIAYATPGAYVPQKEWHRHVLPAGASVQMTAITCTWSMVGNGYELSA